MSITRILSILRESVGRLLAKRVKRTWRQIKEHFGEKTAVNFY